MHISSMRKQPSVLLEEPLTDANLDRKLSEIGFGPFQVTLLVLVGFFCFAQAALGVVEHELLKTESGGRQLTLSVCQAGAFSVGCLASGILSDRFGRRTFVILGYSLMAFALYSSKTTMVDIQLSLVQLGLGLGLPSAISLVGESGPKNLSGMSISLLMLFWLVGEQYVRLGQWLLPGTYQAEVEFLSVPVFFVMLACSVLLHESPACLRSDCFALNLLLRRMRETNRVDGGEVTVQFVPVRVVVGGEGVRWARMFLGGIFLALFNLVLVLARETHVITGLLIEFTFVFCAGLITCFTNTGRVVQIFPFIMAALSAAGLLRSVPPYLVLVLLKAMALALLVLTCTQLSNHGERAGALALGKLMAAVCPWFSKSEYVEMSVGVLGLVVGLVSLGMGRLDDREEVKKKISTIPVLYTPE